MCTTCGCNSGEVAIEASAGAAAGHSHAHPHPHGHSHEHAHPHTHGQEGPPRAHAHAEAHEHRGGESRIVAVERDLLARNDARAAENRAYFQTHAIFALNLVSGPGSGKTSLLVRTAQSLRDELPISVIEGDQQTNRDAERIRAAGVPGLQVNTGKGCHLDADMVGRAVEALGPEESSVLFIENVGNLVCPAAFDLGEAHKVVIISTTEGEDKPLKYPDIVAASDLMLVNKVDLLPHLEFDVDRCIEYAHRVNPEIQTLLVSATTGEGLSAWLDWVRAGRERTLARSNPSLRSAS
jgi:hydrogenase nickel incorporation protein HypB